MFGGNGAVYKTATMLTATSTHSRLSTCPRCVGVQRISLSRLQAEIGDRPFRDFLQSHRDKYDSEQLQAYRDAAQAELRDLPERLRGRFLSEWRSWLIEREGWQQPADVVVGRIMDHARTQLQQAGQSPDEGRLLSIFEWLSLQLVLEAERDEQLSEAMAGPPSFWQRYRWPLALSGASGTALLIGVGGSVVQLGLWGGFLAGLLGIFATELRRQLE